MTKPTQPGSVGYISYPMFIEPTITLGPFRVLWVHMAWHKIVLKKNLFLFRTPPIASVHPIPHLWTTFLPSCDHRNKCHKNATADLYRSPSCTSLNCFLQLTTTRTLASCCGRSLKPSCSLRWLSARSTISSVSSRSVESFEEQRVMQRQ